MDCGVYIQGVGPCLRTGDCSREITTFHAAANTGNAIIGSPLCGKTIGSEAMLIITWESKFEILTLGQCQSVRCNRTVRNFRTIYSHSELDGSTINIIYRRPFITSATKITIAIGTGIIELIVQVIRNSGCTSF